MEEKLKTELVFVDDYCGIQYYIIRHGFTTNTNGDFIWFCAYVMPPKDKEHLDTDEMEVHGGITFKGTYEPLNNIYVWGWDYNHGCDVDYVDGDHFKNKYQLKPVEEVIDIIGDECQEFIRKYLL